MANVVWFCFYVKPKKTGKVVFFLLITRIIRVYPVLVGKTKMLSREREIEKKKQRQKQTDKENVKPKKK